MRLSNLNIKKINLKDVDNNYAGQDILLKLGELYQFESGIYGYGNLWTKLERIVEDILIDELDKAGCIQVDFPKLQPKKIWEQSNRWDTYTKDGDIMFTINNNLGEYGLAPTAEECATIFGANRLESYKNLPATYYQNRLGIKIIPTVSDSGVIGGNVAEEFQAITALGEDIILFDEEKNIGINKEVLEFDNKDMYLEQLGIKEISRLKEYNTIELGNNFQLGIRYSESMKLYFKDENNIDKPYYMGWYGIGLGRIIACLIENNIIKKDNIIKGFSLPYHIAPYKVQIIYTEDNYEFANNLYNELLNNNINAILDDRNNLSLGNRINDVYVLGTPKMIVLGNKFDGNSFEIEDTKTGEKVISNVDNVINELK